MISETRRKATWQELAYRVDELQEKLDNSISKDKIREKIEEIKNKPNNPNQKVIATQIDASLIACLEELLKEE